VLAWYLIGFINIFFRFGTRMVLDFTIIAYERYLAKQGKSNVRDSGFKIQIMYLALKTWHICKDKPIIR